MGEPKAGFSLKRANPTSIFPTKVGTQIHPERLVGFTWAPTFVGKWRKGEGPA